MTFLHFSCVTLTFLKKKKLQNLVHIVFSILQCTGILFAFENVSNIYQFGGYMIFLVIRIENYRALIVFFDQKKQMTTKYFENVSRILIRKAADFSYCSHNDDFLSLGHLKIFRSTCVRVYVGTTKFPQFALLLFKTAHRT